uniref:Peptidase M13 C-terminal domain-containing protein n=1 Tax=Bracon brevicornis TaxID=1563983 RepID=A0A6V7J880_9HYME
MWCAYENDMYLRDYSPFDKHSPAKPRVNGAVSNNNEFSRAFNCPMDSPANPTNKCDI